MPHAPWIGPVGDAPEVTRAVLIRHQEDCQARVVFDRVDAVSGMRIMFLGMCCERLQEGLPGKGVFWQ